ncbi:uncharacterized protein BJ171DRAFT_517177 [Polychytrium aggregatum]|uniref:uncharacterized protein n=1 Tax=Polychytrium aggregatum TaxID=110093 RepID=UPI0022FE6CF6|nr:uncharacterized protein BJ171DRAFT_517177 [Polychytrium aggregatum]KAI9199842.1 hypothetical protein BJ171DRAFT_517177 [Polychytrium aggregatum]
MARHWLVSCLLFLVIAIAAIDRVHAFDFFNFFDNQQQQQQQQQYGGDGHHHHDHHHDHDHDHNHGQHAQASHGGACKGYLCPDTRTCVDLPIVCPCPQPFETKCIVGDWYVCVGPQRNCQDLVSQ